MSELEFSQEELEAIRKEHAPGASDSQFTLFIAECKRRNLVPGRHILFQTRRAKEYDKDTGSYAYIQKPYLITTIAALRLIAQRTGDYLGQGPEEYIYLDKDGNPNIKSDIPLPHEDPTLRPLPREPWVARATVYRKGFSQPMVGTARFEAYAGVVVPKEGKPYLNETWRKRGSEQLFKCAEALALRRAYPEEMSGLLLAEELKEEESAVPVAVTPASVVPLPPPVPKVDQTPATGKEEPRPGETKLGPNPEQDKKLEEERVKAIDEIVEAVKSVAPEPAPKKRGRPAKSPVNGQPAVEGITQEDIDNASKPVVEFDEAKNQQEAKAFVESVTSFTKEEAAAQNLPDPGDNALPSKEQKDGFITRVRALGSPSDRTKIGGYCLALSDKPEAKFMTIADWTAALTNLEAAQKAGTLAELIQKAPLPRF